MKDLNIIRENMYLDDVSKLEAIEAFNLGQARARELKQMGKYINKNSKGELLPTKGKVLFLIEDGAYEPTDIKFQKNLICVVENALFESAGYAFDELEFDKFISPDGRKKTWLIYPHAEDLAE